MASIGAESGLAFVFLLLPAGYFPRRAFWALFFIALALSLPWNIFAFLLGISLMMLIHPIGDFFQFLGGGGVGALGAMIGDSLTAIAIGLHINGTWFISHGKKRQQRKMEKEKAQKQTWRQAQEEVRKKAWGPVFPSGVPGLPGWPGTA